MRSGLKTASASTSTSTSMVAKALARFERYLQGRELRMTGEREAIARAALARHGHFNVDELTHDVQELGVDASRATVYRTLPLLLEAGIIQPTVLTGDRRSYEAAFGKEHHDHLICSRCARVVEFHFEAFEMLQRDVAAKYGFELTSHYHELIGVCADCRARTPKA
jgi:Fur family transcriptional regulator, ferric uptake regulator